MKKTAIIHAAGAFTALIGLSSCGAYSGMGYDDGIYGDEAPQPVYHREAPRYERNYEQSGSYREHLNQKIAGYKDFEQQVQRPAPSYTPMTNVDNYRSEGQQNTTSYNTYGGWGDNAPPSSVNIYNNYTGTSPYYWGSGAWGGYYSSSYYYPRSRWSIGFSVGTYDPYWSWRYYDSYYYPYYGYNYYYPYYGYNYYYPYYGYNYYYPYYGYNYYYYPSYRYNSENNYYYYQDPYGNTSRKYSPTYGRRGDDTSRYENYNYQNGSTSRSYGNSNYDNSSRSYEDNRTRSYDYSSRSYNSNSYNNSNYNNSYDNSSRSYDSSSRSYQGSSGNENSGGGSGTTRRSY
ncbi:hypothetical protein [uncultured Capnocytophaga sp.]|uniref:hypothetical protein n=1 Tax=uncultured Capnocytophaga sp. TaxID=159273 RepID=UPI0026321389|nr:hypothetical protein [uncultured Capnocytophaga sp.]